MKTVPLITQTFMKKQGIFKKIFGTTNYNNYLKHLCLKEKIQKKKEIIKCNIKAMNTV